MQCRFQSSVLVTLGSLWYNKTTVHTNVPARVICPSAGSTWSLLGLGFLIQFIAFVKTESESESHDFKLVIYEGTCFSHLCSSHKWHVHHTHIYDSTSLDRWLLSLLPVCIAALWLLFHWEHMRTNLSSWSSAIHPWWITASRIKVRKHKSSLKSCCLKRCDRNNRNVQLHSQPLGCLSFCDN